jgi:muramoyltetrapeptide carboxypeptidase LdcA involved in peptidoglycan recycling
MLKAIVLQEGDTIGIVSPSWGGLGAFPHRAEAGIKHLESMGFKVKMAEHAANDEGYVSDTAENRAQDIHDMFRDPEVKMILAAIGGDHSCHLLPLLDFDLIRQNPKIFMGYSDITVPNIAIWQQTGLTTFNGPALITDFAEFLEMFDYTEQYFLKAVTKAEPVGKIEPSTFWTEEMLDWETKMDQTRPRHQTESTGWSWLKPGFGEGPLIGGCLESLQHLRGTPYWPDWKGAIMFFETSEEKPSPEKVDGILMDYENMGVLEKLAGMLVGRPMFYNEREKQQLREIILARTEKYNFPIISDMDFGHTAPQFTLPLGCPARIDTQQGTFEIIDAAVRDINQIVISLASLMDELEAVADEFPVYLNTKTGEFAAVSSDAMRMAENDSPLDGLPDWEREMVETAIDILESDDYLELPTPYNIHEFEIMRNFCVTVSDEEVRDALFSSIRGKGSFRHFKDTLIQYGIRDDWFAFRANALEEIAVEWLEDNGLAYYG